MAFTVIPDGQVAFDAGISTQLFVGLRDNDNYLKAVISDAGSSPQDISTSDFETSGNVVLGGDLQVNGQQVRAGVTTSVTSVLSQHTFSDSVAFEGLGSAFGFSLAEPNLGMEWGLLAGLIHMKKLGRGNLLKF